MCCWLQASNGNPHRHFSIKKDQALDPWRIPSRSPSVDDQLSPNTSRDGRITLCIKIHGLKMVHSLSLTWKLILKGLSFSSHFSFHVECNTKLWEGKLTHTSILTGSTHLCCIQHSGVPNIPRCCNSLSRRTSLMNFVLNAA